MGDQPENAVEEKVCRVRPISKVEDARLCRWIGLLVFDLCDTGGTSPLTHKRTDVAVFPFAQTMYIRVKRKKMTVFLQVNPKDVVGSVKETLAGLVEKSSDDMRLWSGSVLLDENKSLEHFGIGNDAVLGLAYRSGESLLVLGSVLDVQSYPVRCPLLTLSSSAVT